ncbi:hypothetical protein K502DRAFT_324684 [Neoconidiobolus thromboides FSU 785]|nr:hypothetical protein K502DRAFT_324684 [Neoconidiobolus thromboides FSU 785]
MTVAIRALTRNIWVHVIEKDNIDRVAKEKVLDLLIAYPVAIKHYLRSEYGTEFNDLKHLIAHLPRYSVPSSLEPIVIDLPDKINDPNNELEMIQKNEEEVSSTNLPIEIAFCISTFIAEYAGKNQLAPPVNSVMIANINSLIDSLSGFERILRTPIPTAYSVHLSQITWLFCLTLPFQLIGKFYIVGVNEQQFKDMLIIPIVLIVVFTSFGIINIGEEIENPFGYDDNDLPLEEYCQLLKQEIKAITSKPPPTMEHFNKNKQNIQAAVPTSPGIAGPASPSADAFSSGGED